MTAETLKASAEALAGDPADPAYRRIRDLIYQASGIYHPEEKLYLLAARCARRMLVVGANTPSQYLQQITARETARAELNLLLNEITIGETYMFRHPPQLEALRKVILPQLIKAKSAMGFRKLRFWSAGCSTGEEPYTLAMFLLEESENTLQSWTFEITATDLNENSLKMAKDGVYGEYALRNTSQPLRKKYFTPVDEKRLRVNDTLKSLIRFDRVNLGDNSKMLFLKGFDIIFCCNVLIYFDLASKRRVVQHFFANLSPNGYLFLGHSESLYAVDDSFRLIHFPNAVAYWKPPLGYAAAKP